MSDRKKPITLAETIAASRASLDEIQGTLDETLRSEPSIVEDRITTMAREPEVTALVKVEQPRQVEPYQQPHRRRRRGGRGGLDLHVVRDAPKPPPRGGLDLHVVRDAPKPPPPPAPTDDLDLDDEALWGTSSAAAPTPAAPAAPTPATTTPTLRTHPHPHPLLRKFGAALGAGTTVADNDWLAGIDIGLRDTSPTMSCGEKILLSGGVAAAAGIAIAAYVQHVGDVARAEAVNAAHERIEAATAEGGPREGLAATKEEVAQLEADGHLDAEEALALRGEIREELAEVRHGELLGAVGQLEGAVGAAAGQNAEGLQRVTELVVEQGNATMGVISSMIDTHNTDRKITHDRIEGVKRSSRRAHKRAEAAEKGRAAAEASRDATRQAATDMQVASANRAAERAAESAERANERAGERASERQSPERDDRPDRAADALEQIAERPIPDGECRPWDK